jgi:branched-chain amino acid transport system permease protein
VTLVYGLALGPAFAARSPLVKMMGTLGLALILLGLMGWRAPPIAASVRILHLPTSDWTYSISGATVNWTQLMALLLALALTAGTTAYLRYTKLGTAMRSLANDREITATLGVPVRRVEAAAWFGCGVVAGAAGLLLSDLLGSLAYDALTFNIVIGGLAAALIGQLRSLWWTLAGGVAIGLIQNLLQPFFLWPTLDHSLSEYRNVVPFVIAILALLWFGRRRVVTISRTQR